MSVLIDVSIFPTDRGESVSQYVARCVDIIDESGLPYHLGPMGTTIEGRTAAEVFAVVEKCLAALQRDCRRVEAMIKLDWRADRDNQLESKVASVREKLGRAVKT